VLILGFVLPPAELGGFFIVVRLADIIAVSSRALGQVVSPQLARLSHTNDGRSLQRVISTSAMLSSSFAVLVSLTFFLFGGEILAFFNPEFASNNQVLSILSVGLALAAFMGPGASLMIMLGYEEADIRMSFFVNVVGLLMIFFLSLTHGAIGAAFGLALTRVCLCILRAAYIWNKSGLMIILPGYIWMKVSSRFTFQRKFK
jgi:O-antigen/teichoic acid export membrane protein